jgi:hypothetical protein
MNKTRERRVLMKSKLFTIVLDYRGGTYMAQSRAVSVASALDVWTRQLPSQRVPRIGAATATALARALREDPPVPLDGLVNAWCATTSVRGALAVINIILTARNAS